MKYLCLCYYDLQRFRDLPPSEAAEIGAACAPHDEALQATGKLLIQASLAMPDTWAHVKPSNGRPRVHAGPYLDGNDQVGAFFIIEADTDEQAQRTASKHAAANYGEHLGFAVEVRACESFETYDRPSTPHAG